MENCAHENCHCSHSGITRNGQQFCSESCANAMSDSGANTGSMCSCGHPDCMREMAGV